jgi:hypothetical protein
MHDFFAQPTRVALWMDTKFPNMAPMIFTCDMTSIGYIRLSEFVEVQFARRVGEDVIAEQLASLDRAEQQVRERFQEALNEINARRADIQQLPFIPAANATKTDPREDTCPF